MARKSKLRIGDKIGIRNIVRQADHTAPSAKHEPLSIDSDDVRFSRLQTIDAIPAERAGLSNPELRQAIAGHQYHGVSNAAAVSG